MGLRIFSSKVALKSVAGSSAVSVLVLTVSGVEFASSSGGCSVSSLLGVLLVLVRYRCSSCACAEQWACGDGRYQVGRAEMSLLRRRDQAKSIRLYELKSQAEIQLWEMQQVL
eukprot:g57039.t1